MSPNTYALPVGVYGHGMHTVVMDELEVGERAAIHLDGENNMPELFVEALSFQLGEW